MKTLIDAIINNPRPQSAVHFIRGTQDQGSISYEQLQKRGRGLLAYFQDRGIRRGDELILITQRNEAFLEGFWAAVFGGNPAVPVAFGIADEHKWKLFRIWKQLRAPWLMMDVAHVSRIEKFAEKQHLIEEWEQIKARLITVEQIPAFSREGDYAEVQPEDTAIIQFSSGTTSIPKGVVLSHRNLITNLQGIVEGMKMNDQDSTFSWMPLTHDMGLIGFHLTPLFFGIPQYIMPTDLFIRHPLFWLEKISEVGASVTCSPNFGYKHYLNALSRKTDNLAIDLSKLRMIYNGAEPISVSLIHRFMKEQAENRLTETSMFPVYGLAEASLAVAFPEPGRPFRFRTYERESLAPGKKAVEATEGIALVIEGKAVPGTSIRITDEYRKPLPASYVGNIEIKGENVTKGYLDQAELNKEIIQDGWLNTGDLGLITEEGELIVTGRMKDIIFINGQNYYPHDIEQVLELHQLAEQGKVAVCGVNRAGQEEEEILVFLAYKGSVESFYPQIAAIRKTINEQLGIEVHQVLPVRQLPKTTSGKIQRYLLGKEYLEGAFKDVTEELDRLREHRSEGSQGSATEQVIKSICDELIPEKHLGIEDNIFESGTTSLVLAQIHQRIDERYPDKVEVTDFFDYPTIKQLAAYIEEKG